jgi:hypothetical protein
MFNLQKELEKLLEKYLDPRKGGLGLHYDERRKLREEVLPRLGVVADSMVWQTKNHRLEIIDEKGKETLIISTAKGKWAYRPVDIGDELPPEADPKFFFTAHSAWCQYKESGNLTVGLKRPELSEPEWQDGEGKSAEKGLVGEVMKLSATCNEDMEEGAGVTFKVYKEGADPKWDKAVEELASSNKGGKADAEWTYQYRHDPENPLTEKPKYFFIERDRIKGRVFDRKFLYGDVKNPTEMKDIQGLENLYKKVVEPFRLPNDNTHIQSGDLIYNNDHIAICAIPNDSYLSESEVNERYFTIIHNYGYINDDNNKPSIFTETSIFTDGFFHKTLQGPFRHWGVHLVGDEINASVGRIYLWY